MLTAQQVAELFGFPVHYVHDYKHKFGAVQLVARGKLYFDEDYVRKVLAEHTLSQEGDEEDAVPAEIGKMADGGKGKRQKEDKGLPKPESSTPVAKSPKKTRWTSKDPHGLLDGMLNRLS